MCNLQENKGDFEDSGIISSEKVITERSNESETQSYCHSDKSFLAEAVEKYGKFEAEEGKKFEVTVDNSGAPWIITTYIDKLHGPYSYRTAKDYYITHLLGLLGERDAEIVGLRGEVKTQGDLLAVADARMGEISGENERLTARIYQLNYRFGFESNQRLSDLAAESEAKSATIRALEDESERLSGRLASNDKAIVEFREENERLNELITDLRINCDYRGKEVRRLDLDVMELRGQLASKEETIVELRKRVDCLESGLMAVARTAETVNVVGEYSCIADKVGLIVEDLKRTRGLCYEKDAEIERLNGEVERYKVGNGKIVDQFELLQAENDELTLLCADLRDKSENRAKEVTWFDCEVKELRRKLEANELHHKLEAKELCRKLEHKEAMISELDAANKRLTEDNERLLVGGEMAGHTNEGLMADLRLALAKCNRYEELLNRIARLVGSGDDYEVMASKVLEGMNDSAIRIHELDSEVRILSSMVNDVKAELSSVNCGGIGLREKAELVCTDLRRMRDMAYTMEADLTSVVCEDHEGSLPGMVNEICRDVIRLRKDNYSKSGVISGLNAELNGLRDANAGLAGRVMELEAKVLSLRCENEVLNKAIIRGGGVDRVDVAATMSDR